MCDSQNFWNNLLSHISKCYVICMCVCMLNSFSHDQLFGAPWTVAHQTPLFTEFSKPEYWSGLPCSPPRDLPSPWIKLAFPAVPDLQVHPLLLSHWGSTVMSFREIYKWHIYIYIYIYIYLNIKFCGTLTGNNWKSIIYTSNTSSKNDLIIYFKHLVNNNKSYTWTHLRPIYLHI